MTTNSLNTDEREIIKGKLSSVLGKLHVINGEAGLLVNFKDDLHLHPAERGEAIREARSEAHQLVCDVLSLLDSEAAGLSKHGAFNWFLNVFEEEATIQGRTKALVDFSNYVARSMRDLCVEKIRAMGAVWKGMGDQSSGYDEKYFYGKADAAGDIETELQSLTLEQEQK